MSSELPIPIFIALYILTIIVIAPRFMKNRTAYSLTNILRAYNIFQVVSCASIVVKFYQAGFSFTGALSCDSQIERQNYEKLLKIWWFCIFIRAAEFLETVFFILRKKTNQVSFLHVYHHITSLLVVYIPLKYSGGSE
jgi:hypothetical protein